MIVIDILIIVLSVIAGLFLALIVALVVFKLVAVISGDVDGVTQSRNEFIAMLIVLVASCLLTYILIIK